MSVSNVIIVIYKWIFLYLKKYFINAYLNKATSHLQANVSLSVVSKRIVLAFEVEVLAAMYTFH